MERSFNTWIDIPVVEAMEYFQSILNNAYRWAGRYALLIGIIGISFSAFKLANSRMTVKDFWWDTIYKWLAFVVLMTVYPMFTAGLAKMGNEIGVKAGGGYQAIVSNLTQLRNMISQDVATQQAWKDGLQRELNSVLNNYDTSNLEALYNPDKYEYDDYIKAVEQEIKVFNFSPTGDRRRANSIVNEYKTKNKYHIMFDAKTLNAIDSILVRRDINGNVTDNLTDSYVDLDIWLKDADGNDTYFISSSALLRVALLECQVMWAKESQNYLEVKEDLDDSELGWVKKIPESFSAIMKHLVNLLMTMICNIILIFSVICACIQYVMTILEYVIVTSIGALFIPLILFDGTKDIPKKLIPAITGLMMKMLVITICVMFVFFMIAESSINALSDYASMNWVTVADVCFNSVLAFVLTANAPKIAQTILTGQPQLSMGEFVAGMASAAGSVVGTGAAASGAAKAVTKGTVNTVGKMAHMGGRLIGDYKAMKDEAVSGLRDQAEKNGTSPTDLKRMEKQAGHKAFGKAFGKQFARFTGDIAKTAAGGVNEWMHNGRGVKSALQSVPGIGGLVGGKGGSGGGAGGGGGNPKDGPNPFIKYSSFVGTAKNEEKDGERYSAGGFIGARAEQGYRSGFKSNWNKHSSQNIVDSVWKKNTGEDLKKKRKEAEKAEKSNPKPDTSLGENLTGNTRESGE